MLMKSLALVEVPIEVTTLDRRKCRMIAWYVIVQCLVVFAGAYTVLYCIWNPDGTHYEIDKIARVMYLYDSKSCKYQLSAEHGITNVRLSNDTLGGINIYPIKWTPGILTVSARLSASFRKHIKNSVVIHVIWLMIAIGVALVVRNHFRDHIKFVKIMINVFLIMSITVIIFDISMAIIYIVHIQKSITYSMVIRHAGWSLNLKISNPDGFGGWLVIVASCCWLRGLIFTFLNIYSCSVINRIRARILKKEVRSRMIHEGNLSIPEKANEKMAFYNTLYYRAGESEPFYLDATIAVLISWLTLSCRLHPTTQELQEVTLMKLLYLYDPEACEQVYFYNYTVLLRDSLSLKSVQWIVKNECATSFRGKIKIWMCLHMMWLFFCLINKAQGTRIYGFYATLLPFTCCGIALLVFDLVLTGLFLSDTSKTGTEGEIIKYIELNDGKVGSINKTNIDKPFASFFLPDEATGVDTTWISLLFAYASCRGVVQWVINYWIIIDNYYEGLLIYRKLTTKKVEVEGGRSSMLSF